MSSAAWALQTALYGLLANDAPLLALLGGTPRIYDFPPREPAYPHLTLGTVFSRDWSTATESGEEHTLLISVWSRTAGKQQVQAILARLRARLGDAVLTLAGYHLVNIRLVSAEVRRDVDGETVQGIARLRAITEPL